MSEAKRILLLTAWMPADPGRRSLFHELADAIVADGHALDCVVIDWRKVDQVANPPRETRENGYTIHRFQPLASDTIPIMGLPLKWVGSSLRTLPRMVKLLSRNRYDLVVMQSPAPLWASILLSRALSSAKRYLIQWDFTPYHQRAIGMMRDGVVFKSLLWLESAMMRQADVIGCMSPMNIEYLRQNYRLRPDQKVDILPIWSSNLKLEAISRDEVKRRHELPLDRAIAVFGGTLSHGRGIEDILAAATLAAARGSSLHFVIVGSGPLEAEVRAMAAPLANVTVMKGLPRKAYLELLQASDIGLVATERDTGVPTFPSKTMDYFVAGVAVVASVEQSTDFGSFLMEHGAGLAVDAGDHEALYEACETLAKGDRKASMAAVGRKLLDEHFDVKHTVTALVKAAR